MFKVEPKVLRRLRKQLQQATEDHARWHESLIRIIVCRLRCDSVDLGDDAHRHCKFGRWCLEEAPTELREQPTFAAIIDEHERVHIAAARLLRKAADNRPISTEDYDELADRAAQLRLELDTMRHEIQGALRSTDALTGAYGRVEMLPELREWHELAKRDVQRCCLAFMDIDHLKEINDQHGHAIGDEVLAESVRFVMEDLRPYDKVFRYGGDEFLISLPGVELEVGRKIMQRVREGLSGTQLAVGVDGAPIHTTASFGLAMLEPDVRVEESIDRADKALLLAKAAGRNRVMTWDPTVTTGTLPEKMVAEGLSDTAER